MWPGLWETLSRQGMVPVLKILEAAALVDCAGSTRSHFDATTERESPALVWAPRWLWLSTTMGLCHLTW